MKIASHLGISTARAKKEISASGYWRWLYFIEEDQKEHKKTDYYFAQIAYEIQLLRMLHWSGKDENGNTVEFPFKTFGEYLIPKIEMKNSEPAEPELTEEEKKQKLELSKLVWKARLGGGNTKPRRKEKASGK